VPEVLPNTTDWYGRFRMAGNRANDHLIDRAAQRAKTSYTGIESVHGQDQMITESMGEIVDHSFETLAPSDLMIAQTRRRILRTVRAFAETGAAPPGVDDPMIYLGARSGQYVAPRGEHWMGTYEERLARAERVPVPAE
jgi:phthalate 4,5-dioxygenase